MKYQHIFIETVLNGFIVRVGCKKAVFTNGADIATALREYYEDPPLAEKKWLENSWSIDDGQEPPCVENPVPHSMPPDHAAWLDANLKGTGQ